VPREPVFIEWPVRSLEPETGPIRIPVAIPIAIPPQERIIEYKPEPARESYPRREAERAIQPPLTPPVEAAPLARPMVPRPKPVTTKETTPEQKKALIPNKKTPENNSPNNSESIRDGNKNNSPPELFAPDKPASQADVPAYKKKGKIGRQRKYDELGNNEIEPVKEVILLMHHTGEHWPGMSKDMQDYYDYWYFTRPNRRKDGKDYERHLKCYERKERWINPAIASV